MARLSRTRGLFVSCSFYIVKLSDLICFSLNVQHFTECSQVTEYCPGWKMIGRSKMFLTVIPKIPTNPGEI